MTAVYPRRRHRRFEIYLPYLRILLETFSVLIG